MVDWSAPFGTPVVWTSCKIAPNFMGPIAKLLATKFSCCMRLRLALFLCAFCAVSTFASAQSLASVSTDLEDVSHLVIDRWHFTDRQNQRAFIDFEAIGVNLESIRVTAPSGEVMWSDDVSTLPVDVIYEVDYSTYPAGNYTLEIRSYTGKITKALTVE